MGIPTSIESGLFQAGRLITQLFIVGMGTAALAANTISSNINGFINVPGNALSMGVMILIGHRVGRGELDDVKRTTLFSVICGMIVMGIICALVFLTLGPLTAVYSLTGEAASTFRVLVTACCVASPLFWASSFVTPSALRAASDVKYTMIIAIASMWLFRIAVGYILGIVFEFGVLGVWIGMFVDWMVRSVMFLRRMTSEKWRVKLAER
jgi:Na+-driven multidrug efflux pump